MRFTLLFLFTLNSCDFPEKNPQTERWWTDADRLFIITELDRTTQEIREEIEELTTEQWNFREKPDRWNIAEIIEQATLVHNKFDKQTAMEYHFLENQLEIFYEKEAEASAIFKVI